MLYYDLTARRDVKRRKKIVNTGIVFVKTPLHRAATFVPSLSDQKIDQDVQGLPQTRKVLSLCNCCSTTLVRSLSHQNCCSGTTGRAKEADWRQNHRHGGSRVAVVAEWRHSGRHSYRSMDPNGRPKEAQWWHKGGRSIAQIDYATQCLQQYAPPVHPLCDHGDAYLPSNEWYFLWYCTCVCNIPCDWMKITIVRLDKMPAFY